MYLQGRTRLLEAAISMVNYVVIIWSKLQGLIYTMYTVYLPKLGTGLANLKTGVTFELSITLFWEVHFQMWQLASFKV